MQASDAAFSEIKVEKSKLDAQIVAFLNSAVGMWFLSSVVITGGAVVIQQIQHRYEVGKKSSPATARLSNAEMLWRDPNSLEIN